MPPSGLRVPALTILSHPNVGRVGERAVLWEDTEGGEAFLARREITFEQPRGGEPRGLEDPYLSRRPARFSAARFGGIRLDCTRTSTRLIANEDWITEDRVFLGVEVQRGVILVLSERVSLVLHNVELDAVDPAAGGSGEAYDFGLVGESSAMVRLRRDIEQYGNTASPILLRGEAGTGKKMVARALHEAGEGERPFVAVHLDGETSLSAVSDLLDRAAGGTLVLDALHRTDEGVQSWLSQELSGGDRSVRVIATCSDVRSRGSLGPLDEALDWIGLEVPALIQRRDDVGRLVYHFLHEELGKLDALERLADPGPYAFPWFPVRLVSALASHEWPGNIRQLRDVIARLAVEYHKQDHIDVDLAVDIDRFLEGGSESSSTGWGLFEDSRESSADLKPRTPTETEVLAALRAHRWQAEPAAAQLGLEPEVLLAMMEEKFSREPDGRDPDRPKRPRRRRST